MAHHEVNTIVKVNDVDPYLRGLSAYVDDTVDVLGYYASEDWGDKRTYKLTSFPIAPNDNGGTIIDYVGGGNLRWVMDLSTSIHINIKWFGVFPSESANQNQLKKCIYATVEHYNDSDFNSSATRPMVYAPKGKYPITGIIGVDENCNGLYFYGEAVNYLENGVTGVGHLVNHRGTFPSWSPHTNDFRIVDEANSVIFAYAQSAGVNKDGIRVLNNGGGDTQNIKFENIAFDGGRTQTDWDNNNAGMLWGIYYDYSHIKNITWVNCAAYRANRSGWLVLGDNLKIENCLSYNNGHHGFATAEGGGELINSEAHHNWRAGHYGVDFSSRTSWIGRGLNLHHNDGAMKFSNIVTGELHECLAEYNLLRGFTVQVGADYVYMDVEANYNGREGVRFVTGAVKEGGRIAGRGNCKNIPTLIDNEKYNILLATADVDWIYSGDPPGPEGGVRFTGNPSVGYLNVEDSDPRGIYTYYGASQDVKIFSGLVKNNEGAIDIRHSGDTVSIVHTKFDGNVGNEFKGVGTVNQAHLLGNPQYDSGIQVNNINTNLSAPTLSSPPDKETGVEVIDLELSWGVVSGATHYLVQLASDIDFNNMVFVRLVTTTQVAVKYKLSYLTKYYWRVYALTINGGITDTSVFSSVRDFTTGSEVLTEPILVYPPNDETGISVDVTLKWEEASGATHYGVVVSKNSDLTNPVVNESDVGDVNDYLVSGLLDYETKYYWQITAYDDDEPPNSEESEVWSFTTKAEGAPAKPVLIYPSNGAGGVALNATATWTKGDGATYHGIMVSENSDLSYPVIDESNIGNVAEYQFSGLSQSVTYYWQVSATNDKGTTYSHDDNYWSFTTEEDVQILRPYSTIDAGGWEVVTDGEETEPHEVLVEISDGKYIKPTAVDGDPCIVTLRADNYPATTPSSKDGWKLQKLRIKNVGSNKIVVDLLEIVNSEIEVRSNWEITTEYADFTEIELTVPTEDAGNIINVNNLRLSCSYVSGT